jgi:homospermidine synthase
VATTMKGFELAGEWDALDQLLEETGGELTPEIESLMDGLNASTNEKIERIALVVLRKKSEAKAIKEQADRLAARGKARENAATRLTEYLTRVMQSVGKDKVEGVLVTVVFQKGPPALMVDDSWDTDALRGLQMVRPELVRYIPESFAVDKRAVIDAANAGTNPPHGMELTRNTSLRIR